MSTCLRRAWLLAVVAGCSHSDPLTPSTRSQAITQPSPPAPLTLPPSPIVPGTQAGTIAGHGWVAPSGEYDYELPLEVPPGRAGVQPQLAMTYSSRAPAGFGGVGWQLSGLSTIEPCPRTFDTEGQSRGVQFDGTDALCLDGQKLIAVAGTPPSASGEYRTENESFARILYGCGCTGTNLASCGKCDGAPSHFRVMLKNGRIRDYAPIVSTDGTKVFAWPIAKEQDRAGNSMTYHYTVFNDLASAIEWYPDEIDYTGQENTGEQGKRAVKFAWTAGDSTAVRRGGVTFGSTVALDSISMRAPDPTATKEVWRYTFGYGSSATSKRTLLSSVERCGALGSCTLTRNFQWTSTGPAPALGTFNASPSFPTVGDYAALVMDINGDGRDELLMQATSPAPGTGAITLYTTTDPAHPLANATNEPWLFDLANASVGDLNGDHVPELVTGNMSGFGIAYAAFQWAGTTWNVTQTSLNPYTQYSQPLYLLDLDGDGQLDLVGAHADTSIIVNGIPNRWTWNYRLNTGSGTFSASTDFTNVPGGEHCYPIRANATAPNDVYVTDRGDGRAIAFACANDNGVEGFGWDPNATPHETYSTIGTAFAWADLDGDGVRDAIWFDSVNEQIAIQFASRTWGSSIDQGVPIYDTHPDHWFAAVADFDKDGREELFLSNQLDSYLLHYDFATNKVSLLPTNLPQLARVRVGDFNGDGVPDLLGWAPGAATAAIYTVSAPTTDYLTMVSDAGTVPDEEIAYSTQWHKSVPIDPPTPCLYPYRCPTNGITVARTHFVWQGHDVAGVQRHYYEYESPYFEERGRGFLGFQSVREWEPDRPRETTTTFSFVGAADGVPPTATSILRATPILAESFGGGIANPATATARIVETDYTLTEEAPNGGLTHYVHPSSFTEREWEEAVSIDWTNDDDLHVYNIDNAGVYATAPPPNDLRDLDGAWTLDGYGNVTDFYIEGAGVPRKESQIVYEHRPATWLISLVSTQTESSSTNASPVARHAAYTYDPAGNVATVVLEQGDPSSDIPETVTISRDGDGQQRTVTLSATGQSDRHFYYDYDHVERTFVSQTWNDLGQSTFTLTHPGYGVPSVTMDTQGTKVTRWFDDLGRVTSTLDDAGTQVDYAYSLRTSGSYTAGTIVTASDHAGGARRVSFDELGRPVESAHLGFDGNWILRDTTYDTLGRAIVDTRPGMGAPSSNVIKRRFDSLDRPIATQLADGSLFQYVQTFSSTFAYDPLNHMRFVMHDKGGRLTKSVEMHNGAQIAMTYQYGDFDLLTTSTDSKGNVTQQTWDRRGRRTKIVDPDAGTTTSAYNGFGDVRSSTAAGATSTYLFDAIGRTQYTLNHDGISTFTWDTAYPGRLTSNTSPDGTVHAYGYDPVGRVAQETWTVGSDTFAFARNYDAFGRPSQLTYPLVPGRAQLVVQSNYNPSGYLASVDDLTGGVDHPLWTVVTRNADDKLTQASLGNGLGDTRTYDPQTGHLTAINDSFVLALSYGYDADGLLKSRTDALRSRTETIGHDDLHRISEWDVAYGGTTASYGYGYDDLGNLTTVAYNGATLEANTYGLSGTLPHAITSRRFGTTFYTTANFAYDTRGRQTNGINRSSVTYTEQNLPRTVVQSPTSTTTFAYDAVGTRVKKSSPSGATITLGGLYERRDTPAGQEHVFYVLGESAPVAQITVAGTTYLHHDAGGSVVLATDATGAVVERYDYEPFGKRVNPNGSQSLATGGDVRLSFAGQRHDDELALIDMHGRVYDPYVRRFLTPDPLVAQPTDQQAFNRYSYVLNQPFDFVDPSGFANDTPDGGDDGSGIVIWYSSDGGDGGYGGSAGSPTVAAAWVNPWAVAPSPRPAIKYDHFNATLPIGSASLSSSSGPPPSPYTPSGFWHGHCPGEQRCHVDPPGQHALRISGVFGFAGVEIPSTPPLGFGPVEFQIKTEIYGIYGSEKERESSPQTSYSGTIVAVASELSIGPVSFIYGDGMETTTTSSRPSTIRTFDLSIGPLGAGLYWMPSGDQGVYLFGGKKGVGGGVGITLGKSDWETGPPPDMSWLRDANAHFFSNSPSMEQLIPDDHFAREFQRQMQGIMDRGFSGAPKNFALTPLSNGASRGFQLPTQYQLTL